MQTTEDRDNLLVTIIHPILHCHMSKMVDMLK